MGSRRTRGVNHLLLMELMKKLPNVERKGLLVAAPVMWFEVFNVLKELTCSSPTCYSLLRQPSSSSYIFLLANSSLRIIISKVQISGQTLLKGRDSYKDRTFPSLKVSFSTLPTIFLVFYILTSPFP